VSTEDLYSTAPRDAAREWFRKARFGLFIHYALPSLFPEGSNDFKKLLAGRDDLGKICLLAPEEIERQEISPADVRTCLKIKNDLAGRFAAERFDADAICDLALAAGMRYVTFTTRHAGGLFLYRTSVTGFNTADGAAGRDLLAELAPACAKRGLGLFLYVPPDTARTDGWLRERNATVLRELLSGYGPVAGIWFDGIALFVRNPENYEHLAAHYQLVRSLQPQALVSFKEGALGEEDFITPEHFIMPDPVEWRDRDRQACWEDHLAHWQKAHQPRHHLFRNALREINTTMQEAVWRDGRGEDCGWVNNEKARHLGAGEVIFLLDVAASRHANLLMNIGLRADGSIHPADDSALREAGERIRSSSSHL
jgi:alpha-L-fucosidase